MKQNRIDLLLLIYTFLAMAVCFPAALYHVVMFFYEKGLLHFLVGFGAIIVGAALIFLAVLRSKGYKLKYYFSRKKFKFLVAKALVNFNLKNYKFAQVFIKTRKPIYYSTGKLFYEETSFGDEYRDPAIKQKIILLYSVLLKSIKEGTGFDGFIDDFKNMDFESDWQAYTYMCNESLSKELQYIISEVYMLTDFCFSPENTQEVIVNNEKTKAVLAQIFNPILFNFEQELESVLERLSGFKEDNNAR